MVSITVNLDSITLERARAVVEQRGETIADAIGIWLKSVADEADETPNAQTISAMEALKRGEGYAASSVSELLRQLHADN